MNELIKIIALFIILISSACAISKKENDRFDKQASIGISDNSLLSDSVSAESLQYFEDRAIQKLIDFYDYLNILGHEDFNESIKTEIRLSVERLFYNSTHEIYPYKAEEDKVMTLSYLLVENVGKNAIPELDILHIEISQKLIKNENAFYQGSMTFDIKDREAAIIITKKAQFSLRQIEKKFGDEIAKVWEVFLDEIQ